MSRDSRRVDASTSRSKKMYDTIACRMNIGATMMISERPNSPRGSTRLTMRPGRRPPWSGDVVWDEDIADAAHGLEVKRKLGVFFDLAAQARDLHVDRTLERHAQPRAEIGAAEGASGIGGGEL